MQSIGSVLKKFNPIEDKYISREFQSYGIYLSEMLHDHKHKSLYIKLAKTVHRSILEKALSYCKDARTDTPNKGALFMWKMKQLKMALKMIQTNQVNSAFNKVYDLIQQVPKGKVTTYGIIGKKLHMSARVVGFALHANPDGSKNPCHRVVNREGRLAPGFAFGGMSIQKQLLAQEGVEFVDQNHVNIEKYLFNF